MPPGRSAAVATIRPRSSRPRCATCRPRASIACFVTGDLTHISLPAEFQVARTQLERLGSPDQVFLIPGNHDCYVPSAGDGRLGPLGSLSARAPARGGRRRARAVADRAAGLRPRTAPRRLSDASHRRPRRGDRPLLCDCDAALSCGRSAGADSARATAAAARAARRARDVPRLDDPPSGPSPW